MTNSDDSPPYTEDSSVNVLRSELLDLGTFVAKLQCMDVGPLTFVQSSVDV